MSLNLWGSLNGLPNGQGTELLIGLSQFFGEFKDGKKHGIGIVSFVTGQRNVQKYENGDLMNALCSRK